MTNTPSNQTSKHSNRKWWGMLVAVVLLFFVLLWVFKIPFLQKNQKAVDLEHADVWVHSENLSLLPRDFLKVPLLKSLLTEDFLYFYDHDEDWLSLQGAVRRISFEHDLNWSDTLLKKIADAPVDLYMWHDDSHALQYWALSMERDQLTVIAEKLATLKLVADKQVHEVGRITVNGTEVPVLSIALSSYRNMVLAVYQNRLLLLSDISMIGLNDGRLDKQGEALFENLLSNDPLQRAQVVSDWHLEDKALFQQTAQQTIFLSNRFFAQGYGTFIPSMRAIRFDYNGEQWLTRADVLPSNFDTTLWQYVPADAAFCASMPIDWNAMQSVVANAQGINEKPILSSIFEESGAICWYSEENNDITQPLVILLRQSESHSTDQLRALFDWGIATNKDHLKQVISLNRQLRQTNSQLTGANDELDALKKKKFSKDLSKEDLAALKLDWNNNKTSLMERIEDIKSELVAIQQQITTAKDAVKEQELKSHENLEKQDGDFTILSRKLAISPYKNSTPQLAMNAEVVYFTSHDALMQRAIAVGSKRYPNLQESVDVLDKNAQQFLYINPEKFADLIQKTGHKALPQGLNLRAAFDYHMPARLATLAKLKPFSLSMDEPPVPSNASNQEKSTWKPLSWRTGEAQ